MEPIIRHSKPVRIWIFMRQNGRQLYQLSPAEN